MKSNNNCKIMNGERKSSIAYISCAFAVAAEQGIVNFEMTTPLDILIGR